MRKVWKVKGKTITKELEEGKMKNLGSMPMIQNTKLFNDLQKSPEWGTLFNDGRGTLKDDRIPILAVGLDCIEYDKNGIYFHDIGLEKYGWLLDNSFGIVKQ